MEQASSLFSQQAGGTPAPLWANPSGFCGNRPISRRAAAALLGLALFAAPPAEGDVAAVTATPTERERTVGPPQPAAALRTVLSAAETDYMTRRQALGRLDRRLPPAAVEDLCALLDRKTVPGLDRDELLGLKDAVCSLLERQVEYPPALPQRLIAMYRDRAHDDGWRDYCIQHLNAGYARFDSDETRAVARAAFWEATAEIAGTIAGTASIALFDRAAESAAERRALADRALEIASNPAAGHPARTTALQIGARLGDTRFLPVARGLVGAGGDLPSRLSALAAIGYLGDASDRGLLSGYASGSDRLMRTAARAALERLDERGKP